MGDSIFLDSGSILLNLALSGRPFDGWPLGRISNLIGDMSSGKTALAVEASMLALRQPPPGVKKIRVCYVETEAAFDHGYAKLLGLPVDEVEWAQIETVEELYDHLVEMSESLKGDEGALVVVDSLDALTSKDELETKISQGTYGMTKQKKLGELFRRMTRVMGLSRIHLMMVSQVRENIDALPFAPKYRRSGGRALDFYATHIVWLQERGKLKQENRVYGIDILAKCSKNKVAKPFREASFPILFDFGIDNTVSMIRFLSDEFSPKEYKILKEKGGWYSWNCFEGRTRLADFVDRIEKDLGLFRQLVENTELAWNEIERKVEVDRVDRVELLREAKRRISEDRTAEKPRTFKRFGRGGSSSENISKQQ